jgi:hypothetical protein
MCCAPPAIAAASLPISHGVKADVAPQFPHPRALARREQRFADLPEARHRLLPGVGIGAAHRVAQQVENRRLGRPASLGQPQLLLPPVAPAGSCRDHRARFQLLHHAPQRLFGDPEQREQVRNRQPRLARDEIKRAVMRPAQLDLGEPGVDRAPQRRMGEKQKFDAAAHLSLAQEKGRGGGNL